MKSCLTFTQSATELENDIASGSALKLLRDRVWFTTALFPRDHSADYHRKQLAGVRPMSIQSFLGWLRRVSRKYGTHAVIPILNLFLSPLMLACHSVAVRVRKAFTVEQNEACIAVSRVHVVIADALKDGHVDQTEERQIAEQIEAAKMELDDLRISGRVEL